MKVPNRFSSVLLACCCCLANANAAVILIVDVSNPNAVTFTSTTANSQADDPNANLIDGIDLLSFWQQAAGGAGFGNPMVSNLIPSGTVSPYTFWGADNFPGGIPFDDLNLWGSPGVHQFTTTSPAFTGSATADFSAYIAALPGGGMSGDIISGYSMGGSGVVIGQWQVTAVPEPVGMGSLAVLLGSGLVIRRRCGLANGNPVLRIVTAVPAEECVERDTGR